MNTAHSNEVTDDNGKETVQAEQDGAHSVTIRDVAKAVGVSPSTVSRAFARPGRVSADTARRIREAADRLGYRVRTVDTVNMTDSNQLNGLLAITVADLGNPIFADYVKAAQRECMRKGFGLLVIDFEETGVIERKAVDLALKHVDGIIFTSSRSSDASIRKIAEIKPVVALNRPIRGVQSIIPDISAGMMQAVAHLKSLRHGEITYLPGPEASWQEGRRWRVVSELCEQENIRLHRLPLNDPSYTGGSHYCEQFLNNPNGAVIAYNDIIAIGFMKALQARHIRVPQDVSVIGVDDTPVSSLVTPALSTIRLPRREPAELAVDDIIARVRRTKQQDAQPRFLKSTFIARSSTAPCSPVYGLAKA